MRKLARVWMVTLALAAIILTIVQIITVNSTDKEIHELKEEAKEVPF